MENHKGSHRSVKVILLWPHDKQGLPLKQLLQDLTEETRNRDVKRVNLQFLPRLQVHSAKIVASGPYTDVHRHFVGFPGSGAVDGKLLRPCSNDLSYQSVIRELRTNAQRMAQSMTSHRAPRRIAALSARRNPIQAATHGCR